MNRFADIDAGMPQRIVPEITHGFRQASARKGKPVPSRKWLVPDWIPGRNVTILNGDGGTGKSLLAYQLAVCCAADRPWLGMPVNGGPALYLSAEDEDAELHHRLDDILQSLGLAYDDVAQLRDRSVAGEDALLAFEDKLALTKSALFEELEAATAQTRPALVVVDTLADVFPANENDRAKVRQFVGMLRGLAIRHDCAVVLLAHPSLSGMTSGSGSSGSTAWNNSVRSRLYLTRIMDSDYEPNPDRRNLRTMKSNYGRIGGEVQMTWKAGCFENDEPEDRLDAKSASSKAERVFLKLLREFTHQGRRVNHAGSSTYAPKVFAEHPASEGVTKVALRAAMNTLLASGKLKIATEGPRSRKVSFIVEAPE